jgi:hypothetical protein
MVGMTCSLSLQIKINWWLQTELFLLDTLQKSVDKVDAKATTDAVNVT